MKQAHPFNSPDKIRKAIQHLKNLDPTTQSFDSISDYINNNIGYIPSNGILIPKGTEFFRARKNPQVKQQFFSHLDELSVRDAALINAYGRANLPHQAVFYAALDLLTAAREVTQWQIDELGALLRKGVSLIDYNPFTQMMTITKWVSNTDMIFFAPYCIAEIPANEIDTFFNPIESKYEVDRRNYLISEKLVLDFFSHEFLKKEINGQFDYFVSAYYSNQVYKSVGVKEKSGLIYRSIANDLDGENVAIPINNLNCLDFVEAEIHYTYNSKNHPNFSDQKIVGAPIFRGTKNEDNSLNWVELI